MTDVIPSVLLGLKVLILVGLVLYAVFAAVVVRQEQLMANVLEESFEPVLRLVVLIHFSAAVGLVLLGFVLL